MKTLKKIGFLFLMTATAGAFLTSCGTDDPLDVVKPKLTLDPDHTFQDRDALPGQNIRIDIVVTSEEKIEDITMTVKNGSNEDVVFEELGVGDKTYSGTISRDANSTVGAVEMWTILVTDKKGGSTSKTLTITTVGESAELVESKGHTFFHIQGPNHGAFDIVTEATVGASSTNGTKDMVDQSTAGNFEAKWGTLNGTEFIVNPAGVTYIAYANKKYSDLEDAWSAGAANKTSTTAALTLGDLLLVKSGQNSKIYLVRMVDVNATAADNKDSYTFDILKAAI